MRSWLSTLRRFCVPDSKLPVTFLGSEPYDIGGSYMSADTRRSVLLQFLALGKSPDIDPIRVMKGLFIIGQEAKPAWLEEKDRYDFVAYDYGPCSFDIYRDLEVLEASGLITRVSVPGRSWETIRLTPTGKKSADARRDELNADLLDYIKVVRNWVTSLAFSDLLKKVYARYPKYATKSVFKY